MKKTTILPLLLLFSASFLQCSDRATGAITDSEFDSDSSGYASDDEAPSPTVISALSEMTNLLLRQQALIDHQRKQTDHQQRQIKDLTTQVLQLQKERGRDNMALNVLFSAVQPKACSSPRSGRSFVTSRARMRTNILFRALQIKPCIKSGKQTGAYVSGLVKTVMREIIKTKHQIAALKKQISQPTAEQASLSVNEVIQ